MTSRRGSLRVKEARWFTEQGNFGCQSAFAPSGASAFAEASARQAGATAFAWLAEPKLTLTEASVSEGW